MLIMAYCGFQEATASGRLCVAFAQMIGSFGLSTISSCIRAFLAFSQVEAIKTKVLFTPSVLQLGFKNRWCSSLFTIGCIGRRVTTARPFRARLPVVHAHPHSPATSPHTRIPPA